jgi:hypothetical protein
MGNREINTSHKLASNGLQDVAGRRGAGGTGVPVREVVQALCFETGQCVGVASRRHFSEIHHDQFHVLSHLLFGAMKSDTFKEASIRLDAPYRDRVFMDFFSVSPGKFPE